MKLNINFLQTGGVPLTNDLMADIMSAIQMYDCFGALAGHCTIISGCEVTGNSVAPGVVAINGEVLVFEGGIASTHVFVDEQQIFKTFQDQNDKILITKKVVKFGLSVAPNLYPWADFVRLDTLKAMKIKLDATVSQQVFDALAERVELLELQTAPIINGGVVFPWRKPVNEIPAGWKECTDFRGKVIVGQDPNDSDFSVIGETIGAKKHKLTNDELPKLTGTFNTTNLNTQTSTGIVSDVSAVTAQMSGSSVGMVHRGMKVAIGNDQEHNNIQPSRIAMYIEPNFA